MTERDIDQRLRELETWTATHDEKCKGRHETILNAVKIATELAAKNDERLDENDKRWAKLSGYAAAASGLAALLGSIIGKLL